MLHHNVVGDEFLKFVHDIDISFMKEDKVMRRIRKARYGKVYFHKWKCRTC